MKIIAIAQRGSKKDFVDLFYIMQKGINFQQIKNLLTEKYSGQYSLPLIMKGLGYFEDAENEPVPIMQQSNQQVPLTAEEWENIKQFMLNTQKTAIKDLTQ